jgi:hypothetical protein
VIQFRSMKKLLAVGGVVAVLGAAAVGVSLVQAQSTPTPTPSTQQNRATAYLEALAKRLNVSVDQLRQAMTDARKDVGLPDPAARRPGDGNGRGPGRPGGPGFAFGRGPLGGFLGHEADAVAGVLKISREQLLQELPGKTLAEVASAHNVSTQDVVNTIVSTANQRIDQMAQARNLPAERVSQLKQEVSERIQQFVTTHRFPARGSGIRS